jgi:hypothetical protein
MTKHQRNLRESTHAPTEDYRPTGGMNQMLACATLAGEINGLNSSLEQQKDSLLITAVKLGAKLSEAKQTVERDFEGWLEDNCPDIKRTNAYNYMKLSREMPELLNDSVQSTGRKLGLTQAIALLSASEEVKEEVMQRIENGEDVKIKEIERLKQTNKFLSDRLKNADEEKKAAQEQTKKAETEMIKAFDKYETEVDVLVQEQLKTKQAEIEQAALNAAAAEYQATIDSLQDTISNQRAKLATIERTGEREKIEAEISENQSKLRQLNQQVANADKNAVYREVFQDFLKQIAQMQAIVKVEDTQISSYEYSTIEILKLARHEMTAFVAQITAVIEQHDHTIDIEE